METTVAGVPWWGAMIALALVWIAGFLAGVGSGRAAAQAQMLGLSAMSRMQAGGIPGLPAGLGNAAQR